MQYHRCAFLWRCPCCGGRGGALVTTARACVGGGARLARGHRWGTSSGGGHGTAQQSLRELPQDATSTIFPDACPSTRNPATPPCTVTWCRWMLPWCRVWARVVHALHLVNSNSRASDAYACPVTWARCSVPLTHNTGLLRSVYVCAGREGCTPRVTAVHMVQFVGAHLRFHDRCAVRCRLRGHTTPRPAWTPPQRAQVSANDVSTGNLHGRRAPAGVFPPYHRTAASACSSQRGWRPDFQIQRPGRWEHM